MTHPGSWNFHLSEKVRIIGTHQAEITSKEIAETTKFGLGTVQGVIKKSYKNNTEGPSPSRMKCGRRKIPTDCDG